MGRPLYSEISERAVLGLALLDNSLIRGPLAGLAVIDFYLSFHRELYSKMLEFSGDGMPFDASTLAEAFEPSNEYAAIGRLVDGNVVLPEVVDQHVKTIRSLSQLRRLQSLSGEISKSIEHGTPPDEIEATLAKKIQFLQLGCDLEGNLLPGSRSNGTGSGGLKAISVTQLLAMDIKPREMLLDPILPEQGLLMLYGYRGTGKTYLALGETQVGQLSCSVLE